MNYLLLRVLVKLCKRINNNIHKILKLMFCLTCVRYDELLESGNSHVRC